MDELVQKHQFKFRIGRTKVNAGDFFSFIRKLNVQLINDTVAVSIPTTIITIYYVASTIVRCHISNISNAFQGHNIPKGSKGSKIAVVDVMQGKLLWNKDFPDLDLRSALSVDGKLIFTTTKGEMLLVKPDPAKFIMLSRARLKGFEFSWSSPAFSKGHLFHRDRTGRVRCLDLTAK